MPAPRSPTSTPSIRQPSATTREAWSLAGLIEREATEHGAAVIDMMAGANLTKSLFATEELTNTRLVRGESTPAAGQGERPVGPRRSGGRAPCGVADARFDRTRDDDVVAVWSAVQRHSDDAACGRACQETARARNLTAEIGRKAVHPGHRGRIPRHVLELSRLGLPSMQPWLVAPEKLVRLRASGRTRTAWSRPAAAIRASIGPRLRRSQSSAPRADRPTPPRAGRRSGGLAHVKEAEADDT